MYTPIELQVALARQADLRAEARTLRFPFRRHEARRAVDGHRAVALRPSVA
jgi:hypothetical protein